MELPDLQHTDNFSEESHTSTATEQNVVLVKRAGLKVFVLILFIQRVQSSCLFPERVAR